MKLNTHLKAVFRQLVLTRAYKTPGNCKGCRTPQHLGCRQPCSMPVIPNFKEILSLHILQEMKHSEGGSTNRGPGIYVPARFMDYFEIFFQ